MFLKYNKQHQKHCLLTWVFCCLFLCVVTAQTSTLITVDAQGKLIYTADSKGNRIPDYSGVGYKNSESPIPNVPIVKTISPIVGDNRIHIQNAIQEVATLPLNADGFRGAILLSKGTYNVSDTIRIATSGIILRGEGENGDGTNIIATKIAQHSLFYIAGTSATNTISSSRKDIVDAYVPIGAKEISVSTPHSFQVNDNVFIHRIPKQSWIDLLNMAQWGWTTSAYDVYYERKITAINENKITLDAPNVDVIDPIYADGELVKFTDNRIRNCAIENMRISSVYASETDEQHGWTAIALQNIAQSWVKNIDVLYFGFSAVHIQSAASFITVDSCRMLDARSQVSGSRRYSFNVDGQRCLVQNCFTRNGRHDFVNGSQTAGPNVFYNCTATNQLNDIGPHHRWSTGILFDNIVANGSINIQNRTNSGTGHGWVAAQTMLWNCKANNIIIQDPQGDHRNWAIGCVAAITNIGVFTTEPLGIVESVGASITSIPSLFKSQLQDRLSTTLLSNQIHQFKANQLNHFTQLSWSLDNDLNVNVIELQKSNDGVKFFAFKQISKSIQKKYSLIDSSVNEAPQYYRIQLRLYNQSTVYSNVLLVSNHSAKALQIFPNPSKQVINIVGIPDDSVVRILESSGKIVHAFTAVSASTSVNTTSFNKGLHQIQIITKGKLITTKSFIKS